MKKRTLLLVVLLTLGAVAWWLWKNNTGNTLAGPLTDFAIQDTASVDRIYIADKVGGVSDLRRATLPSGEPGWTVNGIPAKTFQVELLLRTFKLVELRAPVPKSAEENVLRVMAGTARKVEIYQGKDTPAKIWWVGQSTQDHFGTYMVLEIPGTGRSNVPFSMGMSGFNGVLNNRFSTDLDSWRSSVVTRYPDLAKVQRLQVEHPAQPDQGFVITNANDQMGLQDLQGDPLTMDSVRVRDAMLALRTGSFENIERELSKEARDSVMHSTPLHILTVTSDRGVQRVPFWKKAPRSGERNMELELITEDRDRMYALVNDTSLVVVQRFWFDRILRAKDQLKGKASLPPPR
ncbi:MAG: hypothetical protein LKM36_15585 [Flavobacteriales bacterium]|jgi:hypothetical protein|nr:hypothetical protein [Flavobacteriales bacterium]